LTEKEKNRLNEELQQVQKSLTESDVKRIQADAIELTDLQEAKENLSCLPTLEIEDIAPDIPTVKMTPGYDTTDAGCYELPTSGIFYLTSAFGLQPLSPELLPLIPFFCHSLTLIGTSRRSYNDVAQLIDLYTGGIGLSISAGADFANTDENACLPIMSFAAKCLSRNQQQMFELIDELLCEYNFSDLKRLKQLLLEYRSNMESSVVSNGHRFAISLASRTFTSANAYNENWHGIHQLKRLKELTDDLSETRLQSIADDLKQIGESVLKSNNLKIGLIGEKKDIQTAISLTETLKKKLGTGSDTGFIPPTISYSKTPVREGWSTSSAVSFVASVFQTDRITHEHAPALAVISKVLRSMFLHREIREKGGAYGGFAAYQLENGLFCFASYRDPHIFNTLNVYEAASDFITTGEYTDEDIKEAILQVCAEIDRPDTPNSAAGKAFYRNLTGLTDDIRKAFKDKLLSLNREKVLQVARLYFGNKKKKTSVAVISNENALKDAVEKLKDRPLELHRI